MPAAPPLAFLPPRFDRRVLALSRLLLPIGLRTVADIRELKVTGGDRLVSSMASFEAGESRLLLAFRHPSISDPLCLASLLWRELPRQDRQQGRRLRGIPHSFFLYDRGIPLWAGAPLGWLMSTLALRFGAGLSWESSAVFGGIMIVTGPTVIAPLLRTARLSRRPAALLQWEAIVNDPLGALAAVLAFEVVLVLNTSTTVGGAVWTLVVGIGVATVLGLAGGWGLATAFRRGMGIVFHAPAMVLTVGTFLGGRIHIGLEQHAGGRRVVVVIDEAQNLSPDALEQVRLLTNLETATQKLLQIVLIGQPELRTLLASTEMRQLAQRITARYHLEPLDPEESRAYVRHRMMVAGA